jgi:hypothetical protein
MLAPGAFRIHAMAKYLPKYGFEPVVYTVNPKSLAWSGYLDSNLEDCCPVHRSPGINMGALISMVFKRGLASHGQSRREFRSNKANILKQLVGWVYDEILTFPDAEWPWFVMGKHTLIKLAEQLKPDIVLSSALPFTSHLLAVEVKKRLHIPWIADYRDLWSNSPMKKSGRFALLLQKKVEKAVLDHCDAITTVSEPLAKDLSIDLHKPVHVITNGFDPEEKPDPASRLPDKWREYPLNIVYTGMIYPSQRDLSPLIEALRMLLNSNSIQPGQFSIWLFGPNCHIVEPLIKRYGLESFFHIKGSVSHQHAIHIQKAADLLLFLEWCDEEQKGFFSAKFFEYIGAGKTILGIGPGGGVVDRAIKTSGAGIMEKDPIVIADAFSFFLKNGFFPKQKKTYQPDFNKLKMYTREYQTRILAQLMGKIIVR